MNGRWIYTVLGVLAATLISLGQVRMPEGPGRTMLEQKCSVCHGLESIVNNKLNENDWNNLVGSMISNGAQVSLEERKIIVAYLVANFGPGGAAPPSQTQAAPAEDGAKVYASSCAGCHQAGGTGISGAFPPLAKHVPQLLAAKGGREYLALVVLNGLQGQIRAAGANYDGTMPAFAALSDAQVAAVLNHIRSSWDNDKALGDFKPYTSEEVKNLRTKQLTPQQVLAERGKLDLK
jgi:mono/diheme cytochrome c family protein